MIDPWRMVQGWLWQFQAWRVLVIFLVQWSPPAVSKWIALNTPLAWCLRELMLQQGELHHAAALSASLRENGDA